MQDQNPAIFTKRGAYDGSKNLFSPIKYDFGDSARFDVNDPIKPNRWRVLIQQIDTIDPQAVSRFIKGKISHKEGALTTVKACNVTIHSRPLQDHSLHGQAFFSPSGSRDIRGGLELWRGYFQYVAPVIEPPELAEPPILAWTVRSVRPMIGKMVITLDTRSVAVYKSGPLINVCLEYLRQDRDKNPLQFLSATCIKDASTIRTIKNVSVQGADSLKLKTEDHEIFVAAYFQAAGRPLRYPSLVCVQLSSAVWAPLECCEVIPGQIFRKKKDPWQAYDMSLSSSLRPKDCLQSIRDGLQVLGYSNNNYLQEFGMNVDPNPMTAKGRILPPPTLLYGRNETIRPQDGRWKLRHTALYRPARIEGCAIIVYDGRFTQSQVRHLRQGLLYASNALQIQGMPPDPPVFQKSATSSATLSHIKEAAITHKSIRGNMPNLIIVVLPDTEGRDIYLRVKKAGDIQIGVATQCLKASMAGRGDEHYFSNVWLKINVKLGGINYIPMTQNFPSIRDLARSTLVVGADIKYGGKGRPPKPSYAAIVGNVDSDLSKYVAISRPQDCYAETIQDLADMISDIIRKFMTYREVVEKSADLAPQRILFYRNIDSEGRKPLATI
ncbi:hypothetical protein FRC01_013599 [Tulasnella sp. 417]|nr:hypothetical protein FRC01_013599 [Tulasnella sp. 417]